MRKKDLRRALLSIRNAVAFNTKEQRPFDVLLLENLEMLADLTQSSPSPTGLHFKSGATYTGPVRDGKPEGHGTWLRPDGSSYDGEFKDGLPSGHGTLTSERGDEYDGDFADGFASGHGQMTFGPGKMKSYDGEVANATPQGKGVLTTNAGRLAATFRNGVALAGGTLTRVPADAVTGATRLARRVTSPADAADGAAGDVYPPNACNDASTLKPLWCNVVAH